MSYTKVCELVAAQQAGLAEYSPVYQLGEQIKELAAREPRTATLLAEDLTQEGMGLVACEQKLKARADELHKTAGGKCVCIPPAEAEKVIREFYGLGDAAKTAAPRAAGVNVRLADFL